MSNFQVIIDYNLNMRDHREEIKEIKEGVINKKLQSKPSFKNLFDIQKEKVPAKDRSPRGTNRSRSISQKKGASQQKIGTVPLKKNRQSRISQLSARKSETSINYNQEEAPPQSQNRQKKSATEISQLSQNTEQQESFRRYQTQNFSKQLQEQSKISQYRYTQKSEHSPKNSKSKSARKGSSRNKANSQQQIFKMIINMKNDINRLEKVIEAQEREIRKKLGEGGSQDRRGSKSKANRRVVDWQTLQKLKKTKSFLSDYTEQICSQTDQIGRSYLTKLAQLSNQQQFQQQKYQLPNTTSLLQNNHPGMPQLQKKLKSVSRLLI